LQQRKSEHSQLIQPASKGKALAQKFNRARILLMAADDKTDKIIADNLKGEVRTAAPLLSEEPSRSSDESPL
jgi:hypothetical protein